MFKLSKFIDKIEYENKVILINKKNQSFIKIENNDTINIVKSLPCSINDYEKNSDIVSLVENNIIIDETIDETKEIKKFFYENYISNLNRLSLIILLTQNCNFNCVYCYEKHEKKQTTEKDEKTLVNAIKTYIVENNIQKLHIEWFGGEPLLKYDSICKIMKDLKMFCEEKGKDFSATMTTNAYLLTEEKFLKLYELGCVTYQITIDGLKEVHDKTRKLKNGNSTWSQIIYNLDKIKETNKDYSIRLRFNYCWEIIDHLDEFFIFLKEKYLDDSRFSIYPARMNDYNKDLPVAGIDNRYDYVTTDFLLDKMKEYNILPEHYIKSLVFPSVCYGRMHNNYVIDYDLSIKKCTELLYDECNIVGKIENNRFNIYEEKLNKWIIPPESLIKKYDCINCQDSSICMGGLCSKVWVKKQGITCTPFNNHKKKIVEYYL